MTSDPSLGVAGGYVHPTPSTAIVDRFLAGRDGQSVDLGASYELCRQINAAHGRTYYLATRLLPAAKRPHVHALYAFARYADDLVDHLGLDWSPVRRRHELEVWSKNFLSDLDAGDTEDPVCKAVINTIITLGIDHQDVHAFLRSMAMDLTVSRYQTYDDLYSYVHGSAAVIGTMMLPVLRPVTPTARGPAMDLGVAFQLTNFIRDVGEDFQRGRVYLPQDDLQRFGVTDADLCTTKVGANLRRLLQFEISRTRELYRRAEAGWDLLPASSARCIRSAHNLYAGILDQVEANDYQVLARRAAVPRWRRAAVITRELTRPPRGRKG